MLRVHVVSNKQDNYKFNLISDPTLFSAVSHSCEKLVSLQ